MATITSAGPLQQPYSATGIRIPGFFSWCAKQEKNRIMWTGISLALHGCVITPFTMLAVVLSGAPVALIAFAVFSIFITLVVNLAAMPTRITIPAFLLSILVDAGVIIAAISMGLDFAKVF